MKVTALTFPRRTNGRILAGVARGFADQYGVDVVVVRAALVILTFAGGLGLILYALGFVLSDAPSPTPVARRPVEQMRNLSIGAITLGLCLLMRASGVWLGDQLMVTLIVVVTGFAVMDVLRTTNEPPRWVDSANGSIAEFVGGRHASARIIFGGVLIAVGLFLVGSRDDVASGFRVGFFATALTILGVATLLAPWLARAAQQVADERRQRIRSEERERMAEHLHDSVLQTLALIQRSADDPRRTVTLARRQEQELREWLYGGQAVNADTLSVAVHRAAREVEDMFDVRVEVVVVGDAPADGRSVALAGAIREACVNAAKHSGVDVVSVFVEVAADGVEAYVRDRGRGFDQSSAASDRKGIAQSIEARIERVGGQAAIDSEPGRGTEVRLSLPLRTDSEGTVRS